ncbi:hypothetical protein KP509_33G067000 [Ceratopteris richardii]|uniref:Transmembrane protein 18 n=1 Tax=Ceratopteris richardii TaxID=49495 RepID=A0A8T2QQ38_CERRI|nr:hypothetical protein KP509_33G067000 [Ceratopteris richardii]KAH7286282.1 hypothetical protein KP509_33G067000 [Ceratopteris richardii]
MDQIAALIEEITAEVRKQWITESHGTPSVKESLLAFLHAVDWTEPWLISLLFSHLVVLIIAIKTRKNNNVQTGIFFTALFCVYMAERLNKWLSHRWTLFARQPYFDHHGVFMSSVWSGPLLLIACIILVNGLLSLSSLIIKWKRAELRHRARMAALKEQKAD